MAAVVTHLALETATMERAVRFYSEQFRLTTTAVERRAVAFDVGDTALILRRPTTLPRGGVHVHYALTAPAVEYPRWRSRFPDAPEVRFGDAASLYPFDPDGHCAEIAGFGSDGTGLTGVFEIVLEVATLEPAERAYRALGFEPVDRGEERRRVRLRGPSEAAGTVDLELWEPQVGLAGARGGVHVDFGLRVSAPRQMAHEAFGDDPRAEVIEPSDEMAETTEETRETTEQETETAEEATETTEQATETAGDYPQPGPTGLPTGVTAPNAQHVVVRDRDGHWLHLIEAPD